MRLWRYPKINLPSNIVYYSKTNVKRNATKEPATQTVSIVGESKPWKCERERTIMCRYKDAEITPLVRDLSSRVPSRMMMHSS